MMNWEYYQLKAKYILCKRSINPYVIKSNMLMNIENQNVNTRNVWMIKSLDNGYIQ